MHKGARYFGVLTIGSVWQRVFTIGSAIPRLREQIQTKASNRACLNGHIRSRAREQRRPQFSACTQTRGGEIRGKDVMNPLLASEPALDCEVSSTEAFRSRALF